MKAKISQKTWDHIDRFDRTWVSKILAGDTLKDEEAAMAISAITDYEYCGYWNEGGELRDLLIENIGKERFMKCMNRGLGNLD